MSDTRNRLSLKIREPTATRFREYQSADESQTAALKRLLDAADAPDITVCAECGERILGQYIVDERGTPRHEECAEGDDA